MNSTVIQKALKTKVRLVIFNEINEQKTFKQFLKVLNLLQKNEDEKLLTEYYNLCSLLLDYGEGKQEKGPGDAWQNFLLNYILETENIFSRKSRNLTFGELGTSLKNAVTNDLKYLKRLYRINAKTLKNEIKDRLKLDTLPDCSQMTAGNKSWNQLKIKVENKLDQTDEWENLAQKLGNFYRRTGTGIFNIFKAFKWNSETHKLRGIKNVDDIKLEQLIGYRKQQQKIIENTEKLLANFRANNILLYGARGTGKSSTIKAILNKYCKDGLRLVELVKKDIFHLSQIFTELSQQPNLKFILFLDDLSFGEQENNYKDLKAILEGRTQPIPDNVVIYATSNRKNLIKESNSENNEVNRQETTEEKISLSDRFGIQIIFLTPQKSKYLDIVKGLTKQRGLNINEKSLEKKALQWERQQNGRSGRTARQFVDNLEASLKN